MLAELTDVPVGTGTLYALEDTRSDAGRRRTPRAPLVKLEQDEDDEEEDDDNDDEAEEEQGDADEGKEDDDCFWDPVLGKTSGGGSLDNDFWGPCRERDGFRKHRASQVCGGVVLRKERRARNALETEEADVVQYLAAGGWAGLAEAQSWKNVVVGQRRQPSRAASAVHAGAGQQVLGWSEHQRCDLLLAFEGEARSGLPAVLLYVNHHGSFWHYDGHAEGCPEGAAGRPPLTWKPLTARMDDFRRGLCEALTAVAPERCRFVYAVTTSCSHVHGGGRRRSARRLACPFDPAGDTFHASARECLLEARRMGGPGSEVVWLNQPEESFAPDVLARLIASGKATGFVTLQGGRESRKVRDEDPAGHRFGFCVQNHAARLSDLSERTALEMARHFGWTTEGEPLGQVARDKLSDYLSGQPARTLNASTFFGCETVSTTYLRWLIEERGFTHFRITHFLAYEFRDWGSDYLLPVLQRRHEAKLAGRTGEAECLKLLGNGSYGYNGLESSNYDDLRLITSELSLIHISEPTRRS